MTEKIRIGVLGASGYTGADLVRLLACHPAADIRVLTANAHAGKPMAAVYPHLGGLELPDLLTVEEADWSDLDLVFCGLPHGTTQEIIAGLPEAVKVIDLSADFRLRNPETYAQYYGHAHRAPELTGQRGLWPQRALPRRHPPTPAWWPAPAAIPRRRCCCCCPCSRPGLIEAEDIIIDAKSGVSGAGRSLKEAMLFCEVAEAMQPYAVASHRHAPEIEQELSIAAGKRPADQLHASPDPHEPGRASDLLCAFVGRRRCHRPA